MEQQYDYSRSSSTSNSNMFFILSYIFYIFPINGTMILVRNSRSSCSSCSSSYCSSRRNRKRRGKTSSLMDLKEAGVTMSPAPAMAAEDLNMPQLPSITVK